MTPITRTRFRSRYPTTSFAPGLLFLGGEQGAWYDPSDLSTLFQDAAGTTPVTATGQPVRLMLDKSGRGNHATAPSDAARPVLQADAGGLLHLALNGSSQSMSTSAVNFTGTNKMSVFAGVRKLSDAVTQIIYELSANTGSNNGTFRSTLNAGADRFYYLSKGTTQLEVNSGTGFAAPYTAVLTGLSDIGAPSNILRVNGSQVDISVLSQGTGNYGNYSLFIGSRNNSSLFFNGRLYGLIVRGAQSSAAQITSTERWMAGKTGVTI